MRPLPPDVRHQLIESDQAEWKVIGASSLTDVIQISDHAALCAMYFQGDTPPSKRLSGLLVGERKCLGHDDCVMCVTGILVHTDQDPAWVIGRLLRALKQKKNIKGVETRVSQSDFRSIFSGLRFVEADIRENRYNHAQLCYSPVYRNSEAAATGMVRLSHILSFQ